MWLWVHNFPIDTRPIIVVYIIYYTVDILVNHTPAGIPVINPLIEPYTLLKMQWMSKDALFIFINVLKKKYKWTVYRNIQDDQRVRKNAWSVLWKQQCKDYRVTVTAFILRNLFTRQVKCRYCSSLFTLLRLQRLNFKIFCKVS